MKELIYKESFENKKVLHNVFIPTGQSWKSTENDDLSVIESGQKGVLFNKIISDIECAEKMICLQSFLIQDTGIIEVLVKANQDRGVRVFVMDSAEARLEGSFEEEDSFITSEYKTMLENKFKNRFTHRQAGNLHAKFILIDPKTNPKGTVFTGNFNKKPFFENPELAVELSKDQVNELFQVFVYHFWEHTTDEQTGTMEFDKVRPINKLNIEHLKNSLLTSPNSEISNLKETLLEAVSKAEKEIQLSTFGFDVNHQLSQSILEKLKKGVKVTVFCRPRLKAIKNNIEVLAKHGAKVICHPLIHAKSLVVDNNEAYVFSANFENHGMDTGLEVGVKLTDKQNNDLLKIYANWSKTFPHEYVFEKRLTDIETYQALDETSKLQPVVRVKEEEDKHTSTKVATIKELLNLFSINEPKEFNAKKITINTTARLNTLEKYTVVKELNTGVKLVSTESGRGKKTKTENGVVIDVLKINDIPNLLAILRNENKDYKIYAK